MAQVLSNFKELAAAFGVKSRPAKPAPAPLPESSIDAIQARVGREAGLVWLAMQRQDNSRKSGLPGSLFVSVSDVCRWTRFDRETVVDAVLSLVSHRLIKRITPDGLIAAR